MANHDRDVTLTVGMKAEDVKSTAESLRKDIDNIFKANSGKQLSSSLKAVKVQMQEAYKNSGKLLNTLEKLENRQVPTKAYKELTDQLEKAQELLAQDKDTLANASRFKSILPNSFELANQALQREERLIESINAKMREMEANGTAFKNSAKYQETVDELEEVNNKLADYKQRAQEASNTQPPNMEHWKHFANILSSQVISGVSRVISLFKALTSGVIKAGSALLTVAKNAAKAAANLAKLAGRSILSGISSLIGKIKNLGSALTKNTKSSKSMNDVLKHGLRTLMRYGLGVRSLYFLMRKLRKALGEGIGNLAQYSPAFNNVISNFISALTQLKNSFATAFAPIINVVAPIITTFINLMSAAVTRIGMLIAALTGRNTFIRAKAVQEDFASSLDGAAGSAGRATKAAEKYKKTIAGFDDVEILKGPDDGGSSGGGSGGSGGGGGVDPADMFETVEIPDVIQDWADKLKDAWAEADFSGIGEILGIKLVEGLNSIPWDSIQETSSTFGSSFATFINGLIEVDELGNTIGKTIGEAINTALIAWESFLGDDEKGFHFDSLGTFIADAMNGVLDTTYWNKLADNIVKTANGIFTAAGTWAEKFKFEKLGDELGKGVKRIFNKFDFSIFEWNLTNFGTGLAKFIEGFFENSPMTAVGEAFGNAVDAILVGTNSFLNNLPTETIATDFANAMNKIFENKQLWTDLATTISSTANSIFSLASTWSSKFKFGQMGSSIRTAITNTLNKLSWNDAETAVGNIATGIATALNNIMTADTFKAVGEAIGGGINTAVTGINNFVSNISWDNWATNISAGVNKFFDTIKWENVGATFNSVAEALGKAINGVVEVGYTFIGRIEWKDWGVTIGTAINNFFKNINWAKIGVTFDDFVNGILDGLISAIETIDFETVGANVVTAITNVDWGKLFEKAGDAVYELSVAFGHFLDGLLAGLGDALSTWFEEHVPKEIQQFFADVKAFYKWLTGTDWGFGDVDPNGTLGLGTIKEGGGGTVNPNNSKIPVVVEAVELEDGIPEEKKVLENGKVNANKANTKGVPDNQKTVENGKVNVNKADTKGVPEAQKVVDGVKGKLTKLDKASSIKDLSVEDVTAIYNALQEAKDIPPKYKTATNFTAWVNSYLEDKNITGKSPSGFVAEVKKYIKGKSPEGMTSDGHTAQVDKYTQGKDASGKKSSGHTAQVDNYTEGEKATGKTPTGFTGTIEAYKEAWNKGKGVVKEAVGFTATVAKYLEAEKAKGKNPKDFTGIIAEYKEAYNKGKAIPGKRPEDFKAYLAAYLEADGIKGKNPSDFKAKIKEYLEQGTPDGKSPGGFIGYLKGYKESNKPTGKYPSDFEAQVTDYDDDIPTWKKVLGGFLAKLTGTKAHGGAYYNGAWHDIAQYAAGGYPRHGTTFVAGEAGPEVVGHVGGRTEVLNQSQLASTMYSAVVNGSAKAMNAVLSHMTTCFNSVNANLGYLLSVNTADLMLIQKIDSALNNLDNKMTAVVTGNTVPNSFMVNNSNDLINTLKTMNNMLQYNQDNMVSKDDLADILATMFRQYMNITFYMGDEEVARHANAGNARLNYRFNPVAR